MGGYMFSFKTFKDKRYWILLIPFIIILVGFAVFAPNYFNETPLLLPLFLLLYAGLFWTTYHLWKYFRDKKKKNNMEKDC